MPPTIVLHELHPHAAGIDIGATEHWVCVPSDRDAQPVRKFGAFTADLLLLVDWLERCGIDSVAMESTGSFWIPLFELLEGHGFQVFLGRPAEHEAGPWAQERLE